MSTGHRLAVLSITTLLLLAIVAPASLGVSASDDPTRTDGDTEVATGSGGTNHSAVDRKRDAIAALDAAPWPRGWRRERARDRLVASLEGYRDGDRISTARVFHADAAAIRLLAPFDRWGSSESGRAIRLIVAADARTVNTSIADAKRAVRRYGDSLEAGHRQAARRAIADAERARDRTVSTTDRRYRWASWTTPHSRVARLRTAWRHAQRAIDLVDRGTDPTVAVTTRTDPPRNGTAPITLTLRGHVADVRAYALDNLTVALNGSTVHEVPVNATTAPARNASFSANLTLRRRVATVAVAAEAAARRVDEEVRGRWLRRPDGRWSGPWWDAIRRRGERWRPQRGHRRSPGVDGRSTAVVEFDGDGLPDRYEVNAHGTDPLDPDSDSGRTATNEDGDGTIDGAEDLDGDGLIAVVEASHGTDPLRGDTDDDGLADRFEADPMRPVDPTVRDTDADGVPDGREDVDGDGLVALDEVENGTSLVWADTDRDGLGDRKEIEDVGTNPVSPDTDGDGLLDPQERRLGTDPLRPDTDRDGTADGNETFRTARRDPESGVKISVLGSGDVGSHIEVERVPQPDGSGPAVGPVVRVRNGTPFERATIEMPFEDALSTHVAENVSLYTWKPGEGRPWRRLNSTVDLENRSVSASVTSFSYFTAIPDTAWRAVLADFTARSWPRHEGFADLDGWTHRGAARIRNGSLVVGGGTSDEAVVAPDGSGDYERIQPALDAVPPGGTVHVRAGVYRESLTVATSVRIEGEDATIAGRAGDTGVRIDGDVDVSLAGLTIEGFETGIEGSAASGSVRITDSVVRENEFGIHAEGSAGDWSLVGVDIVDNEDDGLYAWAATGRWRLRAVTIARNGANGLYTGGGQGDWRLHGVAVTENGGDGIGTYYAGGDWSITETDVTGNDWVGISASDSTGDWRLVGVDASGTTSGSGIDAYGSTGNWTLRNVRVAANGASGLYASDSSGEWSIATAVFVDNDGSGIFGRRVGGPWSVTDARIEDNSEFGVLAREGTAIVSIGNASMHGNADVEIANRDSEHPVVASAVWWGRPEGPAPDELEGPVQVEEPCPSPDCVELGDRRTEARADTGRPQPGSQAEGAAGDAADSSSARRRLSIPAGVERVELRARIAGVSAGGATGELRATSGSTVERIAAPAGGLDGFRSVGADLTRFAGETVTLEVRAHGESSVAVDWIDVAVDTDGDGLRDLVENADLGMPAGPRPGAPLGRLDPEIPDSDGDGLLDGEELRAVEVRPGASRVTVEAISARADPLRENSDGGGLNDSAEVDAGSNPFVLETLVVGYALPTMTDGPGDTLDDRNPMTVEEAHGLQNDGGLTSNLIASPSRQYTHRTLCIAFLTPGPGCSGAWMRGVDLEEDKFYVYVPFVVYAESNVDVGAIPYHLQIGSRFDSELVKAVRVNGTVSPGSSQRGYVVYALPDARTYEESQPGAFRTIGRVQLRADLSNTVFSDQSARAVGRGYSVSTSTLLPATEKMLEDTQYVLEQGMNVAFAAQAGYAVAVQTGSRTRGAIVFLFDLAKAQVETPPKTIGEVATSASVKGIGAFEEQVGEARGRIRDSIFDGGVARSVGPTIVQTN